MAKVKCWEGPHERNLSKDSEKRCPWWGHRVGRTDPTGPRGRIWFSFYPESRGHKAGPQNGQWLLTDTQDRIRFSLHGLYCLIKTLSLQPQLLSLSPFLGYRKWSFLVFLKQVALFSSLKGLRPHFLSSLLSVLKYPNLKGSFSLALLYSPSLALVFLVLSTLCHGIRVLVYFVPVCLHTGVLRVGPFIAQWFFLTCDI